MTVLDTIREALARMPLLTQVGLRTSDRKTQGQETNSNADFFSGLISKIEAWTEAENSLPTEYISISNRKECPFAIQYCEGCAKGSVSPFGDGKTRKIYDVSECYREFIYKQLLKASRIKGGQLTETFENAEINRFNKSLYSDLQKWNYKSGKGIYIAAEKDENNPQGNGTGKSYALSALAHRLCKAGVKCLYTSTIDFFSEIKSTYDEFARENEARVMERYVNVPILLWDDLGKESFSKNSEWAPEKIYYIVDKRETQSKPIVISSNFNIIELEYRFGEGNHGPAIASRLAQHCGSNYYSLGGPDRRMKIYT